MPILLQASLSGGELPPSLHGMVDIAWYKNCLKACYNFVVQPYGGIKNRSGSYFLGETKYSTSKSRLVPFSFSTEQTYVLEFGNRYMRIWADGVLQTYGTTPPSDWATTTFYNVADYVRQSGVDYYCTTKHGSGVFADDLTAGYWHPLEDSGSTGAILEVPIGFVTTDTDSSELQDMKFTQSADVLTTVHRKYAPSQLLRYSATKWVFQAQALDSGPFQNVNTDSTISVAASATTGTVTLACSGDIFYPKHIGMLFYLEQKDFGISWLPGVSKAIGDVVRSGGNYYIALNPGTTGQNIPIGTSDRWHDGGVDWKYLHNGFGVVRITAVTNAKTATGLVLSRLPDGAQTAGYAGPIAVTAISPNNFDVADLTVTAVGHGLTIGFYGTALVTYYESVFMWDSATLTMTVAMEVLTADTVLLHMPTSGWVRADGNPRIVSFNPPITSNASASYKWAFGAFGDPAVGDATNGYGPGFPSAVTYYQQRLVFGGTDLQPDTVWTSKTSDYSDFGTSNPVLDDDSVIFTMGSNQVNSVRSLLQLDKLLVLTSGAVWATGTGAQTDVMTPGNISVKVQSYQGTSTLPPLGVGGAALYAQEKAFVVRDLNYQWANDAYTGQNLTARGSHLIDGHTFKEWTFQQSPSNVVWMVRDDGVLIGMTYLREQEVVAWHRHGTDGEYESVCSVSEGGEDVLYVVVKRTVGGVAKRYVERFATRVVTNIDDAFFVDSGLSFNGANTTARKIKLIGGSTWDSTDLFQVVGDGALFAYPATTDVGDQIVLTDDDGVIYKLTITQVVSTDTAWCVPNKFVPEPLRLSTAAWAWARNTLSGLDHLEGKTVSILADGYVQPQAVVSGGAITLQNPAVKVQVGLPYYSDAETLPLVANTPETIRGNLKLVNTLRAVVNEARSIKAGPDADHLLESKVRMVSDGFDHPNLISGVAEVRLNATWERNGQTLIRHTDPTPLGILALMPEVALGGA